MRMSVGIGPFRFYSGSSRRRRRMTAKDHAESFKGFLVLAAAGLAGYTLYAVATHWGIVAFLGVLMMLTGVPRLLRRVRAKMG